MTLDVSSSGILKEFHPSFFFHIGTTAGSIKKCLDLHLSFDDKERNSLKKEIKAEWIENKKTSQKKLSKYKKAKNKLSLGF